jgi:hypothetical protein
LTFLDELRCGRDSISRFTSFDHWHDYFEDDQDQGATGALVEQDRLKGSCLQRGLSRPARFLLP